MTSSVTVLLTNYLKRSRIKQFKNFWSVYSNELEWQYANCPVLTKDDKRMEM